MREKLQGWRVDRPDRIDDILRVQRVVTNMGYVCNVKEAEIIWERVSEEYCAGWLILPDNDAGICEDVGRVLEPAKKWRER